jgi:hypothetical protein
METKETQTISLRVTAEEIADLDAKAAAAGTSRPDYLRARLFAPDPGPQIAELEKQLNLLTDRLGRMAEQEKPRSCKKPEHAQIYGSGHCRYCDLPIYVPGQGMD